MELYHKILRSTTLVLALVLLFESGLLGETTQQLSRATGMQVAAVVGVKAEVPENEYNVFTAELTKRQQELDEREAAITAREIDARATDNAFGGTAGSGLSTYILSSILFVLLVLIILNYVLDWSRSRRELEAGLGQAA